MRTFSCARIGPHDDPIHRRIASLAHFPPLCIKRLLSRAIAQFLRAPVRGNLADALLDELFGQADLPVSAINPPHGNMCMWVPGIVVRYSDPFHARTDLLFHSSHHPQAGSCMSSFSPNSGG